MGSLFRLCWFVWCVWVRFLFVSVAWLAVVGGFLATVVPFLQFLRLFRTRVTAGVSVVSWLLNLFSSVLWASYVQYG